MTQFGLGLHLFPLITGLLVSQVPFARLFPLAFSDFARGLTGPERHDLISTL